MESSTNFHTCGLLRRGRRREGGGGAYHLLRCIPVLFILFLGQCDHVLELRAPCAQFSNRNANVEKGKLNDEKMIW